MPLPEEIVVVTPARLSLAPSVEKSNDLGLSPVGRLVVRGDSLMAAFTSSSFSSWVTSSKDLY